MLLFCEAERLRHKLILGTIMLDDLGHGYLGGALVQVRLKWPNEIDGSGDSGTAISSLTGDSDKRDTVREEVTRFTACHLVKSSP